MQKLYKEIILAATMVLLGVFSWWFLRYVFYVGNLAAGCWISGIILLIVWGIVLCLAMLLIDDKRILYGSFFLTLVAFGMFFNNEPFSYLIVLIVLFFIFWFAVNRTRKEEEVRIKLDFWRIWKRGFPLVVTGLILVVGFVYYFSPQLTQLKSAEFKVPKQAIETIIKELPSGWVLDSEINQVLSTINNTINRTTEPYKKFIPLGLAIGLVIGLKIVSIIYVGIVIMLSWLILKLLIVAKFVKIEIIKKEVETVML